VIPDPVEHTRAWLSSMVIGLGLCPFADSVFKAGRVRFALCSSGDAAELLEFVSVELRALAAASRDSVETALLIAPSALPDFLDFNDFMGVVESLVEDLGLSGVIQAVGFHPGFVFAQSAPDAPENYTNRSPYPMIHLLREESIAEVAIDSSAMEEIPLRNTRTLQRLGNAQILARLKALVT
jgi:uncharacterized protein